MVEQRKRDMSYEYTQIQEKVLARLQPASVMEEGLAQQIALCRYRLEQIENRLTKTWGQLNKIHAELKHDVLP